VVDSDDYSRTNIRPPTKATIAMIASRSTTRPARTKRPIEMRSVPNTSRSCVTVEAHAAWVRAQSPCRARDARFSPERIGEALEVRAQLVALCCVSDPRLAWVDLLDAAERSGSSGRGLTPHAAGYQRVLQQLLERLARGLDAGEGPELDGERRLVDQVHRIAP